MSKKSKTVLVQFDRGHSKGLSDYTEDIELVNYYQVPSTGRSEYDLCDLHGSKTLTTATPSQGVGGRGNFMASTGPKSRGYKSTPYTVIGNSLYRINDDNSLFLIGEVRNATGMVSFAENQSQGTDSYGYVCDGVTVYKWLLKEESPTLTEIDRLPLVNGSTDERAIATYISYNTYRLILTCGNSNQWYYSGLSDNNFTDTAWETTESMPDQTVRVISHASTIKAFSRYSLDIFAYTSSATDPYDVPTGGSSNIGCESGDSIAVTGDYIAWLGQSINHNGAVYLMDASGQINRISTPQQENILREWKFRSTAKGFWLNERGLTFYVLTSKEDNYTLCYCLETKMWHRRSTSKNGILSYWDVIQTIMVGGKNVFTTNNSNILGTFDERRIIDHNDYPISRYWNSQVYIDDLNEFRLDQLRVDIECGRSHAPSDVTEIYAQVKWDGSWEERELEDIGAVGEFDKYISFYSLGMGSNMVIRIGTSATVPMTMHQLRLTITPTGRR